MVGVAIAIRGMFSEAADRPMGAYLGVDACCAWTTCDWAAPTVALKIASWVESGASAEPRIELDDARSTG